MFGFFLYATPLTKVITFATVTILDKGTPVFQTTTRMGQVETACGAGWNMMKTDLVWHLGKYKSGI